MFSLTLDPTPPQPGREIARLTDETRKMLARVARKCKRLKIEGYDATDEWVNDLDDVVRRFGHYITHQDVVTMVEAIQNARYESFPESSYVIWQGTDVRQCTGLLDYLHRQGIPMAVARLSRKTRTVQQYTLTVSVEERSFNAAQAAKVAWLEGRTL
jgi:hypothetical protein